MKGPSARFIQRLDSYGRALAKLDELVTAFGSQSHYSIFSPQESGLDMEIAREALIKRFEYTQELSWNLLRDYLRYQGITDLAGSRDVYRKALSLNIIDSNRWMNMILDRNVSAHDYNDSRVAEIADRILNEYHPLLMGLREEMLRRAVEIPEEDR